jgi:hypothetical protein
MLVRPSYKHTSKCQWTAPLDCNSDLFLHFSPPADYEFLCTLLEDCGITSRSIEIRMHIKK